MLSPQRSSACLLSRDERLAVTGLRRSLYVWSTNTCNLVRTVAAHSGRILDMAALTGPHSNCVITSSVDKVTSSQLAATTL